MGYHEISIGLIGIVLALIQYIFHSSLKRLEAKDKELLAMINKEADKTESTIIRIFQSQEKLTNCMTRIETKLSQTKCVNDTVSCSDGDN